MADVEAKPPVASEEKPGSSAVETWRPFESLRREVDRLFEEFDRGLWRFPRALSALEPAWVRGAAPAVEIVERDKD